MGRSKNNDYVARQVMRTVAAAIVLALPSLAFASGSRLTVSTGDDSAGASVVVPSGQRVTVTVDAAPGEWVESGLRVQAPAPATSDYYSNIVRTISAERNTGANSVSIGGPLYYPTEQTTRFEWTTSHLLPGRYRLVALLYDSEGNIKRTPQGRPEFVVSNSFTISDEESADLLPPGSPYESVSALRRAIHLSMTEDEPAVVRLFDMNGEPLTGRGVTTGQAVALAINTSGMATLDNRVRFSLSPADGSPAFSWLEVYPAASFAAQGARASVSEIERAVGPVLIQFFHMPASMLSFDQTGQAELMVRYQRYQGAALPWPPGTSTEPGAALVHGRSTTSVGVTGVPAEEVAANTGAVLDTFKVKIVTPDLGLRRDRLDSLAREVEAYFKYSTKGWFGLEVDVEAVPLADLTIDYRDWWAKQEKDLDRPLDPDVEADMRLIEHIYATEPRHQARIYDAMQEAFVPRSAGEDIAVYVRWAPSSGGAVQSQSTIVTRFEQPLFAIDYERDGLWGRPTPTEPGDALRTEDSRRLIVNIINHELGHAAWQRPLGISLGHCNSSFLKQWSREQNGLDHRVLQFAPGNYSLRRLGWGHTLMSYARNRYLTTNGGGRIVDDQLQMILARYPRITQVRAFKTYVKVYWHSESDPHHFELQWSDTATFEDVAGSYDGIEGSRRWANVMASQLNGQATSHYARLRGCDSRGECGSWSAPRHFQPAAPTVVRLLSMSSYLKVIWESSFGDESHFSIQWSESPDFARVEGAFDSEGVALANGTRWLNLMQWRGLQRGRTYYVRVRSCWRACGHWSAPLGVTY